MTGEENLLALKEDNELASWLSTAGGASAASGALGLGILAERGRRKQSSNADQGIKQSYGSAFKEAAGDALNDARSALSVLTGNTPYDVEKRTGGSAASKGQQSVSLRDWASKTLSDSPYTIQPQEITRYVSNPLTQAAISARDAFIPSSEDFLGFRREERLERGVSPEGPKSDTVISRIPVVDAARDLMPEWAGGFNSSEREARRVQGIDLLRGNSVQAAGGLAGRAASDFINNGIRSVWWLLNAPQAVADVASEGAMGKMNREGLYGLDYALENDARRLGWIEGNQNPQPRNTAVNPVKYNFEDYSANDPQLARRVDMLKAEGQTGNNLYSKRRVGNNLSTLMALPASYLINEGLGLMSLNGEDGRKAVFPTQEDPTKTENVIAEIAAKYILGREGDLLPWDEFKKVRPDVTEDEFRAYKAYRYDKQADLNPFDDGDINLFNGVIKGTDDGLNGSEVMFLGRSMPIATTIIPTAAAIAGSALGAGMARHGSLNIDGVQDSIERTKLSRDVLGDEIDALKASGASEEIIKQMRKRVKSLDKAIEGKQRRLNFMESGPLNRVFKGPARRSGVVGAGLLGAALMGGTASVIGNEAERRRRAYEAELGI